MEWIKITEEDSEELLILRDYLLDNNMLKEYNAILYLVSHNKKPYKTETASYIWIRHVCKEYQTFFSLPDNVFSKLSNHNTNDHTPQYSTYLEAILDFMKAYNEQND